MKVLVIGSTVVDVILKVKQMPCIGEDENIISQDLSIGGCAFNVSHTLRYLHADHDLFSPIGAGVYGSYVKDYFQQHHLNILIETQEENGCCYCIVDSQGERTFLALHGCEYKYKKEWLDSIDLDLYDAVYVCGLELEEQSGQLICEFLKNAKKIFFALSSRLCHIKPEIMATMWQYHPIVHLSLNELFMYTQYHQVEQGARMLYQKTKNLVIVTLGEQGCYYFDGMDHYIAGFKSQVVDTIGAGDCHIASFMAYHLAGLSNDEALMKANYLSSLVVSQKGSRINQ